ncbi:hypothetical protein K7X08_028649 [Anisodus acutangulus]|uniref:Uncharacterized protein n=1 Tax=Anisodus acutangulus TaxID=402998 RepID=A0A9Q1LUM6_9SOLA|nr:hypothetical protein K7X08_028649 [Anisodus acutangulus]
MGRQRPRGPKNKKGPKRGKDHVAKPTSGPSLGCSPAILSYRLKGPSTLGIWSQVGGRSWFHSPILIHTAPSGKTSNESNKWGLLKCPPSEGLIIFLQHCSG